MNKVLKIIIILIMNFTIFAHLSITLAAQSEGTEASGGAGTSQWTKEEKEEKKTNWGDMFSIGDKFIKKGNSSKKNVNEEQLRTDASSIFKILTVTGIALSVIIGGILGIKFMMASAEDKAQIKEMLIPYIVGCVIIYGAFAIWKLVITVLQNI